MQQNHRIFMYFLLLRMLDVNIVLVALIMQKVLEPP